MEAINLPGLLTALGRTSVQAGVLVLVWKTNGNCTGGSG